MKKFRIFLSVCCLAMVAQFASAQRTFWFVDDAGMLRGIKTDKVDYIAFNPDSNWFAMTCDPVSDALGEMTVTSKVTVNGTDVLNLADEGADVEIGVCYSKDTEEPTVSDNGQAVGTVFGGTYTSTISNLYTATYYVRTYMKYHGDVYYSEAYPVYVKGANREIDGHLMIDLALPSGMLWADCNLGAATVTDSGNMYAWGETQPKSTYDWSTYKWSYNEKGDSLTKYAKGVDDLRTLESADDAVTAAWGGSFRMPTKAEFQELIDNCTATQTYRTTASGQKVSGWQFKSKNNKATLFFPYYGGSQFYLWLSTIEKNASQWADLVMGNSTIGVKLDDVYQWRCTGFAVRAVYKP